MAEANTTNVPVVLQVPTSVKALIEALIFGAREPLSVRQIQALYEDQSTNGREPRKIDYEEIHGSVEELNTEYSASDRPYRIIQIAGGYQFATLPLYAEWLGKLYKEQTRRKLSQSSIETLAIVAYKQPITKPEIEAIRGVNCDYVLSTLLEKDLATIVGRAPTVGRPLLYGTSTEFLRHFGLNDLNDLPRPREIQEILGDSQFETERRMLEAQQDVGGKKEEDFKSRLPHIPKRKAGLDDEVKILPKKRIRDIKVLPPEAEGTAKTEESAPQKDPEKPADASMAPVADEKQAQTIDIENPVPQVIPVSENPESGERTEAPAELSNEENDSGISGTLKYFGMPADADLGSTEELSKVEELTSATPDQSSALDNSSVAVQEPASVIEVEEPPRSTEELPQMPSIQVDESAGKAFEQKKLQLSEEPMIQAPMEVAPEPVQDSMIEQVPQAVAPTIEEHEEPMPGPEPQLLAKELHADSSDPHPKTRWKSWKEKIQGFIKKLFG